MTLSQSNIVDTIVCELKSLKQKYQAINIPKNEISEHVSALHDGLGIKILNSIDSDSLGAFIFLNKDNFVLLIDRNCFATTKPITQEETIELLTLFYSCRALTMVPKLYSSVIIEKNKVLNDCITKIYMR